MSSLNDIFRDERRDVLTSDLLDFTEITVNAQTGILGMALKSAFNSIQKGKPSAMRKGLSIALPSVLDSLSPYWEQRHGPFGDYLESQKEAVVDDLLIVADELVKSEKGAGFATTLKAVRPKAKKVLLSNMKQLGDLIEKDAE